MLRTRVGYAGGTSANPTYYKLSDHSETIQIDYDPTRVSYRDLLDVFWSSHSPTQPAGSRQYASIIFYHDDEQKRVALESRDHEAARLNRRIYTEIVPDTGFTWAEDYHQKYRLRQERDLVREFEAMYPAVEDFVNSTAVTHVNGYVGGYGTLANLQAEIDRLGLSPAAQERLLNIVRASNR